MSTHPTPLDGPYSDLPLPGFYPVITMQFNATLHTQSGLAKFVLCVREPTSQVEVLRRGRGLEPGLVQLGRMDSEVQTALRQMYYLGDCGTEQDHLERLRRTH